MPREPKESGGVPHPSNTGAGGRSKTRGRVLALDVGTKRIGIAVSDELRVLARGLDTLKRESKRQDLERIAALAREYQVAEIVVGHPVRLGGEKSAQTEKVEAFAAELQAHTGIPVRLWDERLTSMEAAELLPPKRSAKAHIRERKSGAVDRLAAVIILQGYLEAQGM